MAAEAGRGMVATIDYAVSVLKVNNIIICGHTFCGAMQALFDPETLNKLPDVAKWLEHSEVARRIAHNEVQDVGHFWKPQWYLKIIDINGKYSRYWACGIVKRRHKWMCSQY